MLVSKIKKICINVGLELILMYKVIFKKLKCKFASNITPEQGRTRFRVTNCHQDQWEKKIGLGSTSGLVLSHAGNAKTWPIVT